MNVLLMSVDPVALDATICRLVQLNPAYIPTLQLGQSSGLGSLSDIELVGDDINQFISPGFDVKHENAVGARVPGIALVNNLLVPKPYIIESNCIRCGICVQSCPVNPKAVDWASAARENTPVYNYGRCIRCYCCQEMCPEHAIAIKSSWLRKVLNHLPIGLG
jgi:ferredoxin